jgi:hypothetical protein
MNFRNYLGAATLSAVLTCISGTAAAQSSPEYRIDVTISRNGSLIGKPAIVAKAGAEAELTDQSPGKPDDGFRILVKVSPLSDAPNGKESVKLDLTFFGRFNGKWNERDHHSVTALVGKYVSFAFPSKPPESLGKDYELVISTSHVNPSAIPAR